MKTLFTVSILTFAAAAFLVSDADAKNSNGTCNKIVATALGTAQECTRMSCEPGSAQCMEITNTFIEFVATEGCVAGFQNGELNGLPGNASIQPGGPEAGNTKHISDVICGSIEDCGLCQSALMLGICPTDCMD